MIFRRCLAFAILTVLLALGTIQFWIPAFIYRPAALSRPDPRSWGLKNGIMVKIRYGDGTAITGWWNPPGTSDSPIVLVVHGRSANIASRLPVMKRLVADGLGVFMFDYRGYGASSGRPSEPHLTEDTVAAYRWLRRKGIAARQIVVVGQSLGNAPAAALAAHEPIGALLLVSPFTSLPNAMADRLPWLPIQFLPWTRNRFDVGASISHFEGPVLLIASETDGLVPISDARKLRGHAPHSQWLDVEPLHHDGMLQGIAADGRLTDAVRRMASRACRDQQREKC